MKRLFIATMFIVSLVITAQAGNEPVQPKWMSTPTKELVEKARAVTKQVTIKDLKTAMDAQADIAILDVREPAEYDVAHIPGSVNVPRGLLEFSVWSMLPDTNQKIFVYCKTGARAALATKLLNELGYKEAVAVDTGGVAWVQAGYPVQTSITDEEVVIMPVKK
jgi:rhodanese-related sulfurtransferase